MLDTEVRSMRLALAGDSELNTGNRYVWRGRKEGRKGGREEGREEGRKEGRKERRKMKQIK